MDKPNPTSQVRMSRESHQHAEENIACIYKNWVQECTSQRGGFHNRSCAKFDTVAMVFRKNENCEAGNYKKKKSHEHGLQKYIYIHEVRIKKRKKK